MGERILHRQRRRSAAVEVECVVDAVVLDEEIGDLAYGKAQTPARPVDGKQK